MIENTLVSICNDWLRQFSKKAKDKSLERSNQLISDLTQVSTPEALADLLKNYLTYKNCQPGTKPAGFFPRPELDSKLSEWLERVEFIVRSRQQGKAELEKLQPNVAVQPLFDLINEILDDPEAMLHLCSSELLSLLVNANLKDLGAYLAKLPAVEVVNPRSGSFAALEPVNDNHGAAISLLNNLAAAPPQENNALWEQCNSLLQKTLLIYKDMHPPMAEPAGICILF